jgi:uncharacterized protein (TIGR03083 family)
MQQPSLDQFFGEIGASAATLAEIASSCDADLPVPTCPDWTLRQLATHVGRVHRWAAEIVRTKAAEFIPFNSVPDGAYPARPAERAAWLTRGADQVIAAIQAAGTEPVWAFGALAPATFWARRQAHETMVHRADAELTVGRDVVLDAALAADGIDEWLGSVTDPRYRQRGDGSEALPAGATLHLRATGIESAAGVPGDGPASTADWLIASTAAGLTVQHGPGEADVSVSGRADRLLLTLARRLPADDPAVSVTGDAALLTGWLAGTPF